MLQIQYDLFKTKEECEIEAMEKKIVDLEKTLHKVRKGTFALIGELRKKNLDLNDRLKIIERNICLKGVDSDNDGWTDKKSIAV